MVLTTYPDLLDAERLRERGCDITAKRIRYFQRFAGAPWHMPALNDQPFNDTTSCNANRDSLAMPDLPFVHEVSND